jgi:hypothetical protein
VIGRDVAGSLALLAGGAVGGAVAAGAVGAVVFGLVGGALAAAVVMAQVRWVVALPVIGGVVVGIVVGWSIPHRRCAPDGCPLVEISAAAVTGLGALVGVGLVVALVTRSFDEYREATEQRRPPPAAGCESDERPLP